jgi:hypothetical protein
MYVRVGEPTTTFWSFWIIYIEYMWSSDITPANRYFAKVGFYSMTNARLYPPNISCFHLTMLFNHVPLCFRSVASSTHAGVLCLVALSIELWPSACARIALIGSQLQLSRFGLLQENEVQERVRLQAKTSPNLPPVHFESMFGL